MRHGTKNQPVQSYLPQGENVAPEVEIAEEQLQHLLGFERDTSRKRTDLSGKSSLQRQTSTVARATVTASSDSVHHASLSAMPFSS